MNTDPSFQTKKNKPWAWIPSLYLFQSIPFNIVILTSVVIYKTMGVSLSSIAFWTSLLYLPWTIKLLWSPLVDSISTKRRWVLFTQFFIAAATLLVGASMQTPYFYSVSISLFLLIAFLSASHDISADGFYMLALNHHQQAFFVGIRNSFYRLGRLLALGALTLVAGLLVDRTGLEPQRFEVEATASSVLLPPDSSIVSSLPSSGQPRIVCQPTLVKMGLWEKGRPDSAFVYLSLSSAPVGDQTIVATVSHEDGATEIDLPKKSIGRFEFNAKNWNVPVRCKLLLDHNLRHSSRAVFKVSAGNVGFSWMVSLVSLGVLLLLFAVYHYFCLPAPFDAHRERAAATAYRDVFSSFFSKQGVWPALLFFLLYRLGESQLVKVTPVFLIDERNAGGLGMSTSQFGLAYGTVGILCMTLGGILGGFAAARWGLKAMIRYMAMAMNIPILLYVYMALVQPSADSISVYAMIGLEEMGYGFGFTAYMLYMLHYVGESRFKTAEYAVGTSLMAIGMMLPGMVSGKMVELLGYQHFFIYVVVCQIPGLICLNFLKIDPLFGKKTDRAL